MDEKRIWAVELYCCLILDEHVKEHLSSGLERRLCLPKTGTIDGLGLNGLCVLSNLLGVPLSLSP